MQPLKLRQEENVPIDSRSWLIEFSQNRLNDFSFLFTDNLIILFDTLVTQLLAGGRTFARSDVKGCQGEGGAGSS